MSYLYPRLLSHQARRLFDEYRPLSLDEIETRVATSSDSAVYVATGGDRISEAGLLRLRSR